MAPFWNNLGDGRSVPIHGLGDGIAHILKAHLKAREERQAEEEDERGGGESGRVSGFDNREPGIERGGLSGGGPALHLQEARRHRL